MKMTRCGDCGREITADSDFCAHCGALTDAGRGARCERHPSEPAEAVCIICHTAVCRECVVRTRGRRFCRNHASIRVEQDWALVFDSPDINDAELVRSVLESGGFHVVVRNFGPNTVVWEGGGDSFSSRLALNRLAKVFVPIPEYLDAAKACREWKAAEGR